MHILSFGSGSDGSDGNVDCDGYGNGGSSGGNAFACLQAFCRRPLYIAAVRPRSLHSFVVQMPFLYISRPFSHFSSKNPNKALLFLYILAKVINTKDVNAFYVICVVNTEHFQRKHFTKHIAHRAHALPAGLAKQRFCHSYKTGKDIHHLWCQNNIKQFITYCLCFLLKIYSMIQTLLLL